MRLNTFILTLCVCAFYARAASISSEKKLDDLDNVDLDNVALEPELIDQVTVKDVDNNLRKTIVDIPVKVIEEPTVLDENSNDYVPNNDESITIKRVDIDLANPGEPQRQEHETQNPENYGEKEKAIFGIKKSIEDTEKIFNQGLQKLSNNLKNLFGNNEDLPAIQNNLQNLRHAFTEQIVKLNETITKNLKPDSNQVTKESEKKLKIVESQLQNLQKKFEVGVDTLSEGVEVLTIIREEDETAKTKSIISEEREVVKADAKPDTQPDTKPDTQNGNTASSTLAPTTTSSQAPAISNPVTHFMHQFQNTMSQAFASLTSSVQNTGSTNPISNFFNGLGFPNIIQGSNPTVNINPPAQQGQNTVPAGAQSDTAVPPPTPTPWGPQAILQQVQNTWQNLINPGQNAQQTQTAEGQQTAAPPANNRPFSNAFNNIVQFLQGPNQAAQPNPVNPTPASAQNTNGPSTNSEKPDATQADAIPAPAQQAQPSSQSVPAQQTEEHNGPIQQLVQNNPIIKGIQSAVQRLQGTPNPETPRNEIIKDDSEQKVELKGRPGVNTTNQGDTSVSGLVKNIEEQKEENVIPKDSEEIVEGPIKADNVEIPSVSDKTE
ncbi:translation initiation factor IF-2-like [Nymphalis io]|uniref:translation initiation factor IF-2-like n=1 Tax=Inachis io TaxID=171585 RepID=UPI002167AB9C|nr:translation initiation factor IF-2-like [Nymphalis io]